MDNIIKFFPPEIDYSDKSNEFSRLRVYRFAKEFYDAETAEFVFKFDSNLASMVAQDFGYVDEIKKLKLEIELYKQSLARLKYCQNALDNCSRCIVECPVKSVIDLK